MFYGNCNNNPSFPFNLARPPAAPTLAGQRLEMNLMDKVRQVGENYELNKYKALNKTIELDASLANERLFATKLRLNQVSSMNDKLGKQLRSVQQQFRQQEQKLLLTETMLRQLIEARENHHQSELIKQQFQQQSAQVRQAAGGRLSRLRARKATNVSVAVSARHSVGVQSEQPDSQTSGGALPTTRTDEEQAAKQQVGPGGLLAAAPAPTSRPVSSSATQTQTSRTKMIINDLRQRLNLVGSKSEFPFSLSSIAAR